MYSDLLAQIEVFHDVRELFGIAETEGVEQQVGDLVGIHDTQSEFVILLGPFAVSDRVLILHPLRLDHFREGGHGSAAQRHGGEYAPSGGTGGVDLREPVCGVDGVDHRRDRIGLLDHAHIFFVLLGVRFQIIHEALEIVVADGIGKGSDVLLFH